MGKVTGEASVEESVEVTNEAMGKVTGEAPSEESVEVTSAPVRVRCW